MSDHAGTILVLAKQPLPGLVKTRLQTEFSPDEAASLAAAALQDTLAAVRSAAVDRRVLAWQGDPATADPAFEVTPQPGGTLNDRLTAAFAAVLVDESDPPALLIGMDTPQVGSELLEIHWEGADAVLGLSEDGGFWAIGLRPGHPAGIFDDIAMSTSRTGAAQLARLVGLGLRVLLLPPLRDIDTPADAAHVAYLYPRLGFSRHHAALVGTRPEVGWDQMFDHAYDGSDTVSSTGLAGEQFHIDLDRWGADADAVDALVVSRCQPPVIDLGCGPGRMVRALNRAGRPALGVDVSAAAVAVSMANGGPALRRRLDDPLPAEGRWGTALLMDGNIGIGGDVLRLLRRCRDLVGAGGLIIVEVDVDPERHDLDQVLLTGRTQTAPAMPWVRIGARALHPLAAQLDLSWVEEWTNEHRSFVMLRT